MTATLVAESSSVHNPLADWADSIVQDCSPHTCTTVGLLSGSRFASDRRVIDALTRVVDEARGLRRLALPMLLVRLDVVVGAPLERAPEQSEAAPVPQPSPLGQWSEVTVPVPVGTRASWSLEQLPRWLYAWKRQFRVAIIELGPMHQVPSRVIGRLCDANYILLGPSTCGSRDWILQHAAWHEQSGSTICGCLLTTLDYRATDPLTRTA